MTMNEIPESPKQHGETLDSQIAGETGMPPATVAKRTLTPREPPRRRSGGPPMNDFSDAQPIATTEQFKDALLAMRDWIGISPAQLQMLQAQCRASDSAITAAQIANQLALKNCAAASRQYGTLARAVAEKLGYEPPKTGTGAVRWWFALSVARSGAEDTGDGDFEWIMRPELVAALRRMKWA
jgi:hypothetical protein